MEEKPFVDLLNATAPPTASSNKATPRPESQLTNMGGSGRNGGVSLMAGRGVEARGWERFRPPLAGAVARVTIRDLDGLYEDRSKSFNATKLDGCRLHLDAPPGISFFTPRDEWPRQPPPPKHAPRPRQPPRATSTSVARGPDNDTAGLGAGIPSKTAPMTAAATAATPDAGSASLSAPGASEGNALEDASDDGMGGNAFLMPPPSPAAAPPPPPVQMEAIPKAQDRVAPKRTTQAATVQRTRSVVPPPAGGYCECCATSYTGTTEAHCASVPHQAFMADARHFKAFDALVVSLRNGADDINSSSGPSLPSSSFPMTQQAPSSLAASPMREVEVPNDNRHHTKSLLRESPHSPVDGVSRCAGLLKRPWQQPDEMAMETGSVHESCQQELSVAAACQPSSSAREVPLRAASDAQRLPSPPQVPQAAPPPSGRHRPFVAPSTKLAAPRRLRSNSVTSPSATAAAATSVATAPALTRPDLPTISDVAWNDGYSFEGYARTRRDSVLGGADPSLAIEGGVDGRFGGHMRAAGAGRLSGRRVLHSNSGSSAGALLQGQVEGKRPGKSSYRVILDNGDSEDMSSEELEPLVEAAAAAAAAAQAEAQRASKGAISKRDKGRNSSNNTGPQAPPTVTFASAKDMLKNAKSMNNAGPEAAVTSQESAAAAAAAAASSTSTARETQTPEIAASAQKKSKKQSQGCHVSPSKAPVPAEAAAAASSPATRRRQSLQRAVKDAPTASEITSAAGAQAPSLASPALAKSQQRPSARNSRGSGTQSASRPAPTPVIPGRALKVLYTCTVYKPVLSYSSRMYRNIRSALLLAELTFLSC